MSSASSKQDTTTSARRPQRAVVDDVVVDDHKGEQEQQLAARLSDMGVCASDNAAAADDDSDAAAAANAAPAARCPFGIASNLRGPERMLTEPVPLRVVRGTHQLSRASATLLADIGGGDRLRALFTRFYSLAFQDVVLDTFMFDDDGAVAHGKRFGDWMVQKMGGEGTPWSDSGREGLRQSTHRQAWESVKRPPQLRGRRFKLDDCRIWMRLLFWAARLERLDEHPPFYEWLIEFVQHFIGVYEYTAPAHTRESAAWSADAANVQRYLDGGRNMTDIIGIGVR